MTATFRIDLMDFLGNVLEPDLQFFGVDYNRTMGAVGAMSVTFPDFYPSSFFTRDSVFHIYRTPEGSFNTSLEPGAVWFARNISVDLLTNNRRIQCVDQMDLLRRRIVAYRPTTIYANKTEIEGNGPDYADDLMKAYVRENLGSLAVVDGTGAPDTNRDLSSYISVEADDSKGKLVEEAAAFRRIDSVLKSLKSKSRELGTDVFYDLRYTGSGQFTFVTSTLANVAYRVAGASQPVVFSVEFGNIDDASLEWDFADEKTFAYVTGGGRDGGYAFVRVPSGRETLSPFNRIEEYYAAREDYKDSVLEDMGAKILEEGRPVIRVAGRAIDTNNAQYGKDFFFGDKVTVHAAGYNIECNISSVRNRFSQGKEDLDIRLTGEIPASA